MAPADFRPRLEMEMRLVNPYFFKLYEMAQEFDLPICFHAETIPFRCATSTRRKRLQPL